jgi:hypothetical protein
MDQRILANSPIIQDFHYGPFGCADYSNQNFHFGTQAASSVHLIASFASRSKQVNFPLVEFQYLQDASKPPFCP